MFPELFMGDFQDDGAVGPAGKGDQDGLHVRDDLAERREFAWRDSVIMDSFGLRVAIRLSGASPTMTAVLCCSRSGTILTVFR